MVAELLQLPELVELDRVTQMQIGTGRIEAFLDPQRLAALELRGELGLGQLLGDVDRHGGGVCYNPPVRAQAWEAVRA